MVQFEFILGESELVLAVSGKLENIDYPKYQGNLISFV